MTTGYREAQTRGHNFGLLSEKCLTCDMRLSDYIERGEQCIGGHMTDGAGGALCGCFAPGKIIARSAEEVTCFHCRDLIKNDPCAPPGFDPWTKREQMAGADSSDDDYDIRVSPPMMAARSTLPRFAPADVVQIFKCPGCGRDAAVTCFHCRVDLPARYAAFRETVERVVREEAPAVRVVTDWSERPWRQQRVEPRGFCQLHLDDYRGCTFSCALYAVDVEAWERDTRRELAFMREQLGARAMGKR